jgi:hypothetical protein
MVDFACFLKNSADASFCVRVARGGDGAKSSHSSSICFDWGEKRDGAGRRPERIRNCHDKCAWALTAAALGKKKTREQVLYTSISKRDNTTQLSSIVSFT